MLSGQSVTVALTVSNVGTRDTRQDRWDDRLYLSSDPSLDKTDLQIASFTHVGALAAGASYDLTATFRIPSDADGRFYIVAFTDSNVLGSLPAGAATIGVAQVQVDHDNVPEFRDEGNNTVVVPIDVTLAPAADLQVTSVIVPEHALRGQTLAVTFTVTNAGSTATPALNSVWSDRIYLSADPLLDTAADRFLGEVVHTGVVAANGGSYTVSAEFRLPRDLTGPFYVFVLTDPIPGTSAPRGIVFEGAFEDNNATAAPLPVLIERPPPSDLVVDDITAPATGATGQPITVSFTVRNKAGATAEGSWSDSVYLSADSTWDLGDVLLGKVSHSGDLAVGLTYTAQLTATLPPTRAGAYRIIVRTDIFDEVYEGVDERNNTTASGSAVTVSVPELQLGVPLPTTLSPGVERLYKLTVGSGQTLSVALDAADDLSTNELYVRYGDVPSGLAFDFGAQQALSADPTTVVPSTLAGDYYFLIRGRSGSGVTNATLTVKALPFSVTDVSVDQGGDSRWVTATITGAQFRPDALVKLVRPGIAEVVPANFQVIDATKIIATFDLRDVPHGLYDVAVINPNGAVATLPYRFLVEDALPIDVTIGLGGPRVVPAGETGIYSISLQSLTNVDTPYVFFTFGAPQLGQNPQVFNLPFTTFNSNVRGGPDGQRTDVPFTSLDSEVNTTGLMLAPGYAFDVSAGGYVGLSFSVTSYPGLKAIFDRDFEAYRTAVYDALPELKKAGALDAGVTALSGELSKWFTDPNATLNDCYPLFTPFLFTVTASATPMTRDEFVAAQTTQAESLRTAVLADPTANATLINLAADHDGWVNAYLAALEESGMLRPDDQAPPIRQNPKVASLMATLASGILVGALGQQITGSLTLTAFFEQLHTWYGDAPNTIAPLIGFDHRESLLCDSCDIPVPKTATLADFDLGLSHPTYLESVDVFSPLTAAGTDATVDPLFASLASSNTLTALDLQALFAKSAQTSGATITGPSGYGTSQFVPADVPLPYTVGFANPTDSTTAANEVRVSTVLDSDLAVKTFQLGNIKIGSVTINVPAGRAVFQGDFDLRNSLGFVVRVSAGVDPATRIATWLLQAIDPDTGEVLQDTSRGLLVPNNAQGRGAGFVSWTAQASPTAADGTAITAQARVQLDNHAPFETPTASSTLDASAPQTTLTATPVAPGSADFVVAWHPVDQSGGSGIRHTTVYVRIDDGSWTIWQRQTTATQAVYEGAAGHAYTFLALSVDNAGNREPAPGNDVPSDGTVVDVGGIPQVGPTTHDVGSPPAPSNATATNPLFVEAQAGVPASTPSKPSKFVTVVAPFSGEQFATGIGQSFSGIGPLALLERPDGTFVVSGGENRGALYVFGEVGGNALAPAQQLDTPVFDLKFDGSGGLWATSGGGQLLQLDPTTLQVAQRFGDGLTQALAWDAAKGIFYVSSGDGVETFNPLTQQFGHFSNVRVDDLEVAPNGELWGTSWPNRGDVVSFDSHGRAQVQVRLDGAADSLAFGRPGTPLEGLLFVSARIPSGSTDGANLTMVDLATLQTLAVARGGPSAEQLLATSDGRLLISNGTQVDVLAPLVAPHVLSTNPPNGSIVALPLSSVAVTFDRDMSQSATTAVDSVLNPDNYVLVDSTGARINVTQVTYDAETRTATVHFESPAGDTYTLTVAKRIRSTAGLELDGAVHAHLRRRPGLLAARRRHVRRDALRPRHRHRVVRRPGDEPHGLRPPRAASARARPLAVLPGDCDRCSAPPGRSLAAGHRRGPPERRLRPARLDAGADGDADESAGSAPEPRHRRLRDAVPEHPSGVHGAAAGRGDGRRRLSLHGRRGRPGRNGADVGAPRRSGRSDARSGDGCAAVAAGRDGQGAAARHVARLRHARRLRDADLHDPRRGREPRADPRPACDGAAARGRELHASGQRRPTRKGRCCHSLPTTCRRTRGSTASTVSSSGRPDSPTRASTAASPSPSPTVRTSSRSSSTSRSPRSTRRRSCTASPTARCGRATPCSSRCMPTTSTRSRSRTPSSTRRRERRSTRTRASSAGCRRSTARSRTRCASARVTGGRRPSRRSRSPSSTSTPRRSSIRSRACRSSRTRRSLCSSSRSIPTTRTTSRRYAWRTGHCRVRTGCRRPLRTPPPTCPTARHSTP